MTLRRVVAALLPLVAAAASFAAAAPWLRAFSGGDLALGLALASVVPIALAFGLARVGLRGLVTALVTSAVLLVVVLLGVVLASPTAFHSLGLGFTEGIAHLLSATLPVGGPRWLMVVPVTGAWLAASFAGEALGRSRGSGAPVVVWLVEFTLAYAATTGAPGSEAVQSVALVVLAGGFCLGRRWLLGTERVEQPAGVRHEGISRPLAVGAVTLAAAGVVAGFAVPGVPALSRSPKVLSRRPPVLADPTVTPIGTTIALRSGSDGATSGELFSVATDSPAFGYVTTAVVDRYDGSSWSFVRTFLPTGGRVPSAPGDVPVAGARVVHQHFTIVSSLPGPWMPFLGQPVTTSGVATDVDAGSGMILAGQPLGAGSRYAVTSALADRSLADLAASGVVGVSSESDDGAVPAGLSEDLTTIVGAFERALGVSAAASQPLPFLADVERYLVRNDKRLVASRSSAGTEGGTSFADVSNAVLVTKIATPEQFATFFALLARQIGVPARLATGFRLGAGPDSVLPAGRYVVRRSNAWTWVEIPVAGYGWVAADPTPTATAAQQVQQFSATTTTSTPTTLTPPTAVANTIAGGAHGVAPPVLRRRPASSPLGAIILGALAAVVLAILLALSGAIRRSARRRHRRRGVPERQVVGAWQEVLDGLEEADLGPTAPWTGEEVAQRATERFGMQAGESTRAVAVLADQALFSSANGLDEEDAVSAWAAQSQLHSAVRSALPWHLRVAMFLRVARRR
ncbi:MAG: transglutaminase protein [Acidimicrobiaceae bacterium]|nr:transglutaminase protein [Acidimicrobiaceae bacterium]